MRKCWRIPWGDMPLIVLVLFFQRHIIEGLTQGGIKE
jgi:multiple sugar transport system permease protein